jgi:hypothetical protein
MQFEIFGVAFCDGFAIRTLAFSLEASASPPEHRVMGEPEFSQFAGSSAHCLWALVGVMPGAAVYLLERHGPTLAIPMASDMRRGLTLGRVATGKGGCNTRRLRVRQRRLCLYTRVRTVDAGGATGQ